ncbi:Fatty-acid amide hydrolase 2 [Trichostrongylus colubriformis]|uniref:Fatty-acid amide hydrolase 2 n=1 Tax=Trichostrongylus colubriformis TaxID=6319 RepID=A0AAN8FRE8_TRICO
MSSSLNLYDVLFLKMLRPVYWMLHPILMFISRIYFLTVHLIFEFIHLFTSRIYVTKPTDSLLMISATQAVQKIINREISSQELVEAYIHRIEQVNPIINAVVVKIFDEARTKAREVDTFVVDATDNELDELVNTKPLLGVPFTIKDAMMVDGQIVTCGIFNRKADRCSQTAEVVERMRAAGAILLAISNVPEVCMWVESSNTIYGRTANPYDARRMAGGSSGGEGALLGAAASVIGVGSDIGGSIRMPAFFNGVFGMKTTPGVIPLDGHIPVATEYKAQMLRIGPICRFAEDIPLLVKVMGGDRVPSLNLDEPVSMRKLRIFYMEGINDVPLIQPLSRDMKATLRKAVGYFERKYDLVSHRMDLPLARYAIEMFLVSMYIKGGPKLSEYMLCSEASKGRVNPILELLKFFVGKSNHTLPGILGAIIDNMDALSDEQKKEICYKRDRLIREMKELLGSDGIFLFPSWPCTALYHNQPIFSPVNFAYTALFNAIAFPAIECPMGLDKNGLPLGVQIVAAPNSDRILIAAAKDLEEGFGGWVPAGPL